MTCVLLVAPTLTLISCNPHVTLLPAAACAHACGHLPLCITTLVVIWLGGGLSPGASDNNAMLSLLVNHHNPEITVDNH